MPDLTTENDSPTHRLTIKLDDGKCKTFYVTRKEAEWLTQNINSADKFLVLPGTIDPDAPSFYPKNWSWLERMSAEEFAARVKRHHSTPENLDIDHRKKQRSALLRDWREKNKKPWAEMLKTAKSNLEKSPYYASASEKVQDNLVFYEALRQLDQNL